MCCAVRHIQFPIRNPILAVGDFMRLSHYRSEFYSARVIAGGRIKSLVELPSGYNQTHLDSASNDHRFTQE